MAAGVAVAAGGLGGCASLQATLPGAAPEPPPVLTLEVAAPPPLADLLRTQLDLARVNRLAAGEPLQQGELDRLVAAAPQQARELIDTEGWFNADITATNVGGTPPLVRVDVTAGPRTLVRDIDLQVQGPLADAAPTLPHAARTLRALHADWPLITGMPFRNADWSRAKQASIAGLRAQGYVLADWTSTEAVVDAAVQRADLELTAASGPLFGIGTLQIKGLERQDAQTVRNIANFRAGEPATEVLLLDFQERLQKSDLFDRASVSLQPDANDPAHTAVLVQLGERKLQEATFGVGVGANVGPRLTLNHTHRRPFGQPWLARNSLDIARAHQKWEGELSTQTLPDLYRNLLGGGIDHDDSGTDVVTSGHVRVGRALDNQRVTRLLFVEYQRSTTKSLLGHSSADALAVQYQGVWRSLDDPVLPTRGRAWTGQLGAGVARSDPGDKGPFARLYVRLDAYKPLGANWYGQGRVELGQVFVRDSVQVPEALRFRAGGDESVRGYAYRSLTTKVNGVEVGANVLFTASLEAAHPLLDRIPQLWGAVFVDVGRSAAQWRELNPAVGVGVGLRYRSPVGPVKLDLAYGEEVRKLRLHLSVGLAF